MTGLSDAYALIAESAVALIGFAGVASAFSGRERDFTLAEFGRLGAIIFAAVVPLMGCFSLYVFRDAGYTSAQSYKLTGVLVLLAQGVLWFRGVQSAIQNYRHPDSTTGLAFIFALSGFLVTTVSLYASVAFLGFGSWALVAGFSIQLLFGVFMFWRLLTRAT